MNASAHVRERTYHPRAPRSTLTGAGSAPCHHGELLQGVFEDRGRLHRGLVTLPCPLFRSRVTVQLTYEHAPLQVLPAWKTKALAAARDTLEALHLGPLGGQVTVHSDIEVGRGLGSSTSDVTATVRAVLDATRRWLPPERIAALAVRAERASDPVMYDHMLLFAQREGIVLEDFHRPLPDVNVLGFVVRDGEVDTLAVRPARYDAWEIECFRALRGLTRRAAVRSDAAALGRVATASAQINQRFLPIRRFRSLLALVEECGAIGLQVAHSGTVAGLLWDPAGQWSERALVRAARGLADLGMTDTWHYRLRRSGHGPRAS